MAALTEAAGGRSAALAAAVARARDGSCAVVLVEGRSDQAAVETLAARRGRNLHTEGVYVVPMGGATNIGRFLALFGPRGYGVSLTGLCDLGQEDDFRRGLERAGFGTAPTQAALARLGFFVCVADLEDELIRSLGAARVEQLIEAQGELGPLRTFARQPAHRGESRPRQLRRFMGTRSGRKIRYGHVLAAALDPARLPVPLEALLSRI
ncbi:MAG: ATP-dependent endonuclease [Actinobacteria bacterium]|nr:ATP-dependent endonuclease [Actinomycetota bacterium]